MFIYNRRSLNNKNKKLNIDKIVQFWNNFIKYIAKVRKKRKENKNVTRLDQQMCGYAIFDKRKKPTLSKTDPLPHKKKTTNIQKHDYNQNKNKTL